MAVRPITPWRAYCDHCERKLDVMACDATDAIDEAHHKGWETTAMHALLCTVCIVIWRHKMEKAS